ncbi:survival protein sure-like phosphatase/nucleotidase [Mrakia frigida]|uniref:5'/3'-nucleotidase SurE n=1 Tax=Mrakia frigida TaxID=29902 RepID=UPI003FCC0BAB
MTSSSIPPRKVRVLLTNDDGPPSASESPNIFSFARQLEATLGWDVKVVVPSSQKSWIGKAYQIRDTIVGSYYYPTEPHGLGETSTTSRPLKDGEVAEWILLDGTPATCSNVALFNLFPEGIDLVISGPNHGRNSSSAFALSSGTIGAAMSASVAKVRSIALSYGVFKETGPVTPRSLQLANEVSVKVVGKIWHDWGVDLEGWGSRKDEVDLYTVNVPLVEKYLESPRYYFTRIWRNNYASLFKPLPPADGAPPSLLFHFAPQMAGLVNPDLSTLPPGSDAWAVHSGYISVTPLRSSFAEPGMDALSLGSREGFGELVGNGREWLIDVESKSKI